jgi:hypothetical protein
LGCVEHFHEEVLGRKMKKKSGEREMCKEEKKHRELDE